MTKLTLALMLLHFQTDFNQKVTSTIEFVNTSNKEMHAYCYLDKNHIKISKSHWQSIPEVHQRELIYHELGHCMLNLKHEPMDKVAIMRPKLYSTKLDGSNWHQLVNYMKSKIKEK